MSQPGVRGAIRAQALSIGLAVSPFGIAFGLACVDAGLSVPEAMGFSLLMFTGGSQFAAVRVLGDGGSPWAAIIAAVLLSIRSLAYGVVMAPALQGSRWWRALVSQLMIDESMAIGSAQVDRADKRYGYLAGGLSVLLFWNLSTYVGAALVGSAGDLVTRFGFDATIPAAFLALIWPRLHDPAQRLVAVGGGILALALVPIAPAGVPIIAAGSTVLLARFASQPIDAAGEHNGGTGAIVDEQPGSPAGELA